MSTRRKLYVRNAKPHIYMGHYFQPTPPVHRRWNCAGCGRVGSGSTTMTAYIDWQIAVFRATKEQ